MVTENEIIDIIQCEILIDENIAKRIARRIMYEKILPCPFCGFCKPIVNSAFQIHGESDKYNHYFAVNCECYSGGCGATGCYYKTEDKAIEAWNRRTNVTA